MLSKNEVKISLEEFYKLYSKQERIRVISVLYPFLKTKKNRKFIEEKGVFKITKQVLLKRDIKKLSDTDLCIPCKQMDMLNAIDGACCGKDFTDCNWNELGSIRSYHTVKTSVSKMHSPWYNVFGSELKRYKRLRKMIMSFCQKGITKDINILQLELCSKDGSMRRILVDGTHRVSSLWYLVQKGACPDFDSSNVNLITLSTTEEYKHLLNYIFPVSCAVLEL